LLILLYQSIQMSYNRIIKKHLENSLFQWKTIILYGARQVGKTTLAKEILQEFGDDWFYFDCDLIRYRELFAKQDENIFESNIWNKKIIILDEAQRVENIWLNLKILHDHFPNLQVIATGSSSFDLANKINEPLTGRAVEFMMSSFSIQEIKAKYIPIDIQSKLEDILLYWLYPDVFDKNKDQMFQNISNIANNYLFKDILLFEWLYKSDIVSKLLKLIALQVWSEVSYSELANGLGISNITVQKYIDILEKAFVIFRLTGFSNNPRKEIIKSTKIYFWDIGIRNAIIDNFVNIDSRTDIWAIRENFVIAERKKYLLNNGIHSQLHFWRNYNQQEVDLVEVNNWKITWYEIKRNLKTKAKLPNSFKELYPDSEFEVINRDNFIKNLI